MTKSPRNPEMRFHHEESVILPANPAAVFAFADDHRNLAGHMNENSIMMAGSKFITEIDDAHGKVVGSHIRMRGRVMGVLVDVEEVVTEREPPSHKAWETLGTPRLIVVGSYRMAIDIEPAAEGSTLRVSIDYALPNKNTWIGTLFGKSYARWCVRQMIGDVKRHFSTS